MNADSGKPSNIIRTTWIAVITLLLSSICLGSSRPGKADTITWRFAHFLPATHSLAVAMAEWAQSLQQATDGQLQIAIYPAGQLGSGLDHYDMVRTRVAHLAWIVPGYEQGRFPIFSLLETPFLIRDAVSGARSFHQWYLQHYALEMKSVMPCLVTTSPPGRLNFKGEVVTVPEEMRGKRIRVANATVGRYVRSLGAVTINLPLSEARHALERGMIDAMPFGLYSVQTMSLSAALINHLDLPFSSSPAIVGINQEALAALPDDVRRTVMEYCSNDWSGRTVAAWQKLEDQTLEQYRDKPGHDVYLISAAKAESWVRQADPLVEEWKSLAQRKGMQSPQQAFDSLQTILEANAAGFVLPVATREQRVEVSQ